MWYWLYFFIDNLSRKKNFLIFLICWKSFLKLMLILSFSCFFFMWQEGNLKLKSFINIVNYIDWILNLKTFTFPWSNFYIVKMCYIFMLYWIWFNMVHNWFLTSFYEAYFWCVCYKLDICVAWKFVRWNSKLNVLVFGYGIFVSFDKVIKIGSLCCHLLPYESTVRREVSQSQEEDPLPWNRINWHLSLFSL